MYCIVLLQLFVIFYLFIVITMNTFPITFNLHLKPKIAWLHLKTDCIVVYLKTKYIASENCTSFILIFCNIIKIYCYMLKYILHFQKSSMSDFVTPVWTAKLQVWYFMTWARRITFACLDGLRRGIFS